MDSKANSGEIPQSYKISLTQYFFLNKKKTGSKSQPWKIMYCMLSTANLSKVATIEVFVLQFGSFWTSYFEWLLYTVTIWIPDTMGVWYSNGKVMWLGWSFEYRTFWTINRLFSFQFSDCHLTTKPFDNWTQIYHLNTRLVRFFLNKTCQNLFVIPFSGASGRKNSRDCWRRLEEGNHVKSGSFINDVTQ